MTQTISHLCEITQTISITASTINLTLLSSCTRVTQPRKLHILKVASNRHTCNHFDLCRCVQMELSLSVRLISISSLLKDSLAARGQSVNPMLLHHSGMTTIPVVTVVTSTTKCILGIKVKAVQRNWTLSVVLLPLNKVCHRTLLEIGCLWLTGMRYHLTRSALNNSESPR